MKRVSTLLILLFLTKFSAGQTDFSNCYNTLFNHLLNDRVNNVNIFSDWRNCIKGKQMPSFSATAVSGEMIETQKMKGKVLVINLWFTACIPCIREMPALNRLVKEFKGKDVVFIGLCIDSKKSLKSDFLPKHKFDFIIVPDATKIIQKIGQTGYPTTYIIDKKGNVETAWVGASIDTEAEKSPYLKAKPIIEELLKAE
jgi:peroxiredoxin